MVDAFNVWKEQANDSAYIYLRVKSGIFEQTAKFGQPPCLFHSPIIGIKNKLI